MNLHEYQGKSLLKSFGVPVPEGIIADTPDGAVDAAHVIQNTTGAKMWVIKAQIHAGGRGKGGGVKIARSLQEVKELSGKILGMQLVTPQTGPQGKKVRRVLIVEDIYYPGETQTKEFYISILMNRQTSRNMLVYSTEGGMDIEEVASKTPHMIFSEEINPCIGLAQFQCRKIAFNLGLSGAAYKEMTNILPALYRAYIESDASLIEINPLVKTSDDKIFACDAKVVLDNNALFRQPNLAMLRDFFEEDPIEIEAGSYGLNYVKLDGNVGCMVNGAGLAMATMDIIKLSGGEPANFLDVGGSANAKRVEQAFNIILKDPNVKAILVNIFGGIVRCDRVAEGIVEAYKNIGNIEIPIIVRLQGTNAEIGKEIIDSSGLKVFSAITLEDAAKLVTQILK
ncbi:MAG: ADP-forming succinate--CoA ligase subunit beta [Bacteroidota bacterium]|nr:ADP-forming succinate--CoA ligase subunit beta [Bacteroidota bacterium]